MAEEKYVRDADGILRGADGMAVVDNRDDSDARRRARAKRDLTPAQRARLEPPPVDPLA